MYDIKEIIEYSNNNGYLRIKVLPKSSKSEIVDILDDKTVKIRIKAVPEKWKANKELIRFLAWELEIWKENIEIISGKTDQVKLIRVNNLAEK